MDGGDKGNDSLPFPPEAHNPFHTLLARAALLFGPYPHQTQGLLKLQLKNNKQSLPFRNFQHLVKSEGKGLRKPLIRAILA